MSVSSHHLYTHSVSWKSYQHLRKKAMEQELSWSGLIISLSIAFFLVAGCAITLRLIATSLENNKLHSSPYQNERVLDFHALTGVFSIPTAQAATLSYQAEVNKSTEFVTLTSGQTATQSITFTNTGSATWQPGNVSFETGPYLKTPSQLTTTTWKKFNEPVALSKVVKPNESITVNWSIKAPSLEGTIQENFQLVAGNRPINGSLVRFFVTVAPASASSLSSNIPASPKPATSVSAGVGASSSVMCTASQIVTNGDYTNCNSSSNEGNAGSGMVNNILLPTSPLIRIGLFSSLTPQRFTLDQTFDVVANKQPLASNLPAGTTVTVGYNVVTKQYSLATPSLTYYSTEPLRIIPKSANGVVTILDYRAGQIPQDNRFRNIIEVRYTTPANTVWIINELPLDDYLKGLAETSNSSSVNFQKVMATAARSYAIYHYLRGVNFGLTDASTKHAADHYHLDAYYDQVYRGYNSELRLPTLKQAVEATRGLVVTYNNNPVITPYFSNSDGRTRDWTEVWGSTIMPWLRSVTVPQDMGKTLLGHGVGLSARGALLMINEGKSWQEVLSYFYSGTFIQKIY